MSEFSDGYEAAKAGEKPSLPTERGGYTERNLALDFLCPGLGMLTSIGTGRTRQDDEDYMKGYVAGSNQ